MNRPLQMLELLVLAVLTEGPRHGYGLVKALESRTDGALRVRPGNLYRVLDRLTAADLLEEAPPPEGPLRGAERARGFAITEAGRARLESETAVLSRALGSSPAVRAMLRRNLESLP